MTERKLARVVLIDNVSSIEKADLIDSATVGGWNVVIKKNEFKVGQKAVYFEIDSMIPIEEEKFSFLSNRPSKLYSGVRYHKIRTILLRGVVSQGLLMGLDQLGLSEDLEVDTDLTEILHITKFNDEYSEPESSNCEYESNYPIFFPKTDKKRVQNIADKYRFHSGIYEVTMKLNGTSISIYKYNGKIGLASRNTEIDINEEGSYRTGLLRSGILDFLESFEGNIVVQGELLGPDIQKNQEGFDDYEIYIYDLFDIDSQRYYLPKERYDICLANNLKHVPIIEYVDILKFENVQDIIKYANGRSINAKRREGVVFRALKHDKKGNVYSFKVISNEWLLKQED